MKLILKLVASAGLLLAGCVPFTVGVGRHTAGVVVSEGRGDRSWGLR
jgi:hypothetical protein